MCYTDEDDELWNEDPYEYIRIKFGKKTMIPLPKMVTCDGLPVLSYHVPNEWTRSNTAWVQYFFFFFFLSKSDVVCCQPKKPSNTIVSGFKKEAIFTKSSLKNQS